MGRGRPAGPGRRQKARHRLADGRHVRKRRRPLDAADAERVDGVGAGVRRDGLQALEHHVDVPGNQIVDRRGAAAIGHVHDLCAGHVFEHLAAEMTRRPVARRCIGQFAGIFLGVVDQLLHRIDRQLGRHHQHQVAARHQADRLKVPLDVVRHLGDHVARDGERADRPHADGVAIRRRLRDHIHAQRERAAGAIVDNDGLAEFGGKNARRSVGGAARRLWHDQADRPVGIFSGCSAGQPDKGGESESQITHVSSL
jgi:hypothetical protein